MPPLSHLLAAATRTLAEAGVATPADDARALARHVLHLDDPAELAAVSSMDTASVGVFTELVARRAGRVPLPHLTGTVRFRGIELAVGPGVFVPQPETAAVVSWTVGALRAEGPRAPVLVDLCTGAGTVALALAHEVPGATVHAVERDPAALAWAERNAAARVRAGDRPVHLHLAPVDGCLPELDGQVDLVASNPPYVAVDERHVPDPEVVDHDPEVALFAGSDGLDVVRLVEVAARRLLRPGGLVVIEHSDRQGRTAPAVLTDAGGWVEVADHVDHEGSDRFVTGRWSGGAQG